MIVHARSNGRADRKKPAPMPIRAPPTTNRCADKGFTRVRGRGFYLVLIPRAKFFSALPPVAVAATSSRARSPYPANGTNRRAKPPEERVFRMNVRASARFEGPANGVARWRNAPRSTQPPASRASVCTPLLVWTRTRKMDQRQGRRASKNKRLGPIANPARSALVGLVFWPSGLSPK
jgi:hypothetical protein